ncbi:Prefoldin beta-like protein [Terfezia boudieri ATCC MYA-4762]|uniref:Prefoldin beta-like protein n=1 Tax=Terfezia boudieri ATCC MYA-4762 TaxID=1051890 RepID=A0A3N4LXU7_9PEZI|nr:Prefoldin beta-like protein [Terfezia boudieri ATCC MYA-4762]
MADLSRQLQDVTAQYQEIQKDLADVIAARQKLDSQLQENQNVQKEFATLADDANIYKLIGPVLLKQDKAEAVMNINRRLEHIQSEIKRVETQLKSLGDKSDQKKVEIIQIQTQMQTGAPQGLAA